MMGIGLTPHFFVSGGGTAKREWDAIVGLVTGNFIKRFCTIGWVITALIVLTLYGSDAALTEDADKAWGVATLKLLGPLNIGLVGLIVACLLAALLLSLITIRRCRRSTLCSLRGSRQREQKKNQST